MQFLLVAGKKRTLDQAGGIPFHHENTHNPQLPDERPVTCDIHRSFITRGGHHHAMETKNMRNLDNMTTFLAGLGIGVAASMLLAPQSGNQTQKRIREIANRAGNALNDLGTAAGSAVKDGKRTLQEKQNEATQTLNDLNVKAKRKIDETADAAKTATGQIIDKSKDFAHTAGHKMEIGGRMLQDA